MKDAFLVHDGVMYRPDPSCLNRAWLTPLTSLIEGIWNSFPEQALALLRERIYSNTPLTPACEGMIKVAAKRASLIDEYDFKTQIQEFKGSVRFVIPQSSKAIFSSEMDLNSLFSEAELIQLVLNLKSKAISSSNRPESSRAVGAVLLNADHELISLAWNTNAINKTHHAEFNLVRAYREKYFDLIPDHSTLWVSLKPCAMCAGQLFLNMARPETLKIIYLEDDPGPLSKNSIFCENSDLWNKAGRPQISIRAHS